MKLEYNKSSETIFNDKQHLTEDEERDETESQEPLRLITSILSQKTVPTRFLRNGTPRTFEDIYLVTLPNQKRRYMNRAELAQYSNGIELLNRFLTR